MQTNTYTVLLCIVRCTAVQRLGVEMTQTTSVHSAEDQTAKTGGRWLSGGRLLFEQLSEGFLSILLSIFKMSTGQVKLIWPEMCPNPFKMPIKSIGMQNKYTWS